MCDPVRLRNLYWRPGFCWTIQGKLETLLDGSSENFRVDCRRPMGKARSRRSLVLDTDLSRSWYWLLQFSLTLAELYCLSSAIVVLSTKHEVLYNPLIWLPLNFM